MRIKILAMGLICLFLFSIGAVFAQKPKWYEENMIQMKYDRFKAETTIGLKIELAPKFLPLQRKKPYLQGGINFKGDIATEEAPTVMMAFFAINEEWKFLKYHDLLALVDNEPMEMPETNHDGSVMRGAVIEAIYFGLDWEKFCKLCDAEKVEFRLGLEEFEMSQIEFNILRQLRQAYLDLLKK